MKKFSTCLWFDTNAEEAAEFYRSCFPNSEVLSSLRYGDSGSKVSGQSKGSVLTIELRLEDQVITVLNGGPHFKINPSISLYVSAKSEKEAQSLWEKLSAGGTVMMEFGEYPFAKRFGWCADRFGMTWQVILGQETQKITPFLMFVREQAGKAEEAMKFYTSIFKNSKIDSIRRSKETGQVEHGVFTLGGQQFMALDSGAEHKFNFNEAVSIEVACESQAEVDEYWEKLIAGGGKHSQCGWLSDRFGVSWQITPTVLKDLLTQPDSIKAEKVMAAMLEMTKLDIAALKAASK